MDVSVLTVTSNSVDHIAEQISSVALFGRDFAVEQLIADNASDDGTVTVIRRKSPDLPLTVYKENRGFGAANNDLATRATGRYFLLLNPDMKIMPGSMVSLVAWADTHSQAGIVSCKLVDQDGNFNTKTAPRRFPTVFDQLVILFKLHHLFPRLLDNYLMRNFDTEKEQPVDSVQGSFMLVRRELYEKLGHLFDPRYFIWFEDVDLCREAKRLGYEVWYVPSVSCIDYGGRSFAQRGFFWKQLQFMKSLFSYFMKWGL